MRSLLIYLALVLVPVAGLFGILHVGARLQAPPALGGEWTVEAPAAAHAPNCDRWRAELRDGGLSISQSGTHLVLSVNAGGERRLRGSLRGELLEAQDEASRRASSVPGNAACDPSRGLWLVATVDTAARPGAMKGVVRFASCRACAGVPFTAVRRPPATRGARGH